MDHCISLTENDIPGASLKGRPPELLKKDELKRWLQCRGAHVSGSKEDLVRRVKEYVEAGLTNRLTDPDDGANLQRKRESLGIIPGGKENLPSLAPVDGWSAGLGNIPNINTPVVIEYLITGRAVTSDGGQMDAFRSKKGENFYAEKYVHDYKHNNSAAGLCYISAKVYASMKKEKYRVELCVQKVPVKVLTGHCTCPAGEWPSAACSHVAALLYAAQDFVVQGLNKEGTCTDRLQQWHRPVKRSIQPTQVQTHVFKKPKLKEHLEITARPTADRYDPRPPTERHTDDHRLATFKEGLKRLGYSTGWLMQLTASSPVVARGTTCLPPQFPLTEEELASASSAKKKEMCHN